MDSFFRDIRHSLRLFWQNRGFTATAVAALAIGIGLNTAIFSIIDTILLRPPAFPQAERIVLFMNTSPQGSGTAGSPAKFAHWQQQTSVVEDVAAFRGGVINWTGGDLPVQLRWGQVSAAYFKLFGAPVILGRTFSGEEDSPNGPHTTVISEGLWTRRFHRDPNILGKVIELAGQPNTVIGVIGKRFDFRDFGADPEVWTAFQLDPNTHDQGHYFTVGGRLKPGVTLEQAKARLALSAEEFRHKFPDALQPKDSFSVESLREALVSNSRSTLIVLGCAVGLVLLIACANVANLLLARAISRRREIAIRAALGAGRWRVIRQLLTESLMLAAAGAAIGSVLGMVGIRALLLVNTANLPRLGEDGALVGVDWRVLLFAAAVTVLTSVLFGLFPAFQSSRADLGATLKESASRSGSGRSQNRGRAALAVSEIALAAMLLIGAALLIRTALALAAVNPGFAADHVLTMRMSLNSAKYTKTAAVEQLTRDGLERLRAIPGVVSASATCCIPLEGGYGLPFRVMGRPLDKGPFHGGGGWQTLAPGFFDVFKIPILRGRAFNERDNAAGTPVVIINQAMAQKFWPKGDPLSDRILIGKGIMSELAAEMPRQIIGIAGNVRDGALNREPGPTMYVPYAQTTDAINALNVRLTPLAWVVRTRADPTALRAPIQEQLRQLCGLPVSDVRTMSEVVSRSTSRQRFNMLLMSVFAAAALLLAVIGVYGLMAYSVQQRTQEIGIRMALGAETGHVRKMVLFQGMRFALLGVVAGTAAAFGLARLMKTFLFGVEATDPLVFALVPVVLSLTALGAVWIPALRATRVDPASSLRCE
ncbi:MAG TPA: ABC transporter permease [Bryobacteraceae bacterium]|jgi:predicted permease